MHSSWEKVLTCRLEPHGAVTHVLMRPFCRSQHPDLARAEQGLLLPTSYLRSRFGINTYTGDELCPDRRAASLTFPFLASLMSASIQYQALLERSSCVIGNFQGIASLHQIFLPLFRACTVTYLAHQHCGFSN